MTYFSSNRLSIEPGIGAPAVRVAGESGPTLCFAANSRFIATELRPSVALFYRFATLAGSIADSRDVSSKEKRRDLERLDAILTGTSATEDSPARHVAAHLRTDFLARGLPLDHLRHLLQAAQADAANRPCRSWSDLLAYCRYAAAPAGRFVLDLHGEDRAAWPAAEALCSALTIVGRIRDCQTEWRVHRRLYIPLDWLTGAGAHPDDLLAPRCTSALRQALGQVLDGLDRLHGAAAELPRHIRDRGLRMEAARTLALSRRLAVRLRRGDPIAERIDVSSYDRGFATFTGLSYAWRR